MFPCEVFYSYVFDETFIEVAQFHETSDALKTSWLCGCTQVLFFLQNAPFLIFDSLLNTPLSRQLLSNLYSDLMLRTASDTFTSLAYSELCLFRYIQVYSSIFSIIKVYSHILRHFHSIFSTLCNPCIDSHLAIFRPLTLRTGGIFKCR